MGVVEIRFAVWYVRMAPTPTEESDMQIIQYTVHA